MIRLATYSLGDLIISASKEIAGSGPQACSGLRMFESVLPLH